MYHNLNPENLKILCTIRFHFYRSCYTDYYNLFSQHWDSEENHTWYKKDKAKVSHLWMQEDICSSTQGEMRADWWKCMWLHLNSCLVELSRHRLHAGKTLQSIPGYKHTAVILYVIYILRGMVKYTLLYSNNTLKCFVCIITIFGFFLSNSAN